MENRQTIEETRPLHEKIHENDSALWRIVLAATLILVPATPFKIMSQETPAQIERAGDHLRGLQESMLRAHDPT